jgi:hypothetical protein
MGTTAEKLTYLNTTKGKIKDSINLTGAGITNNDTFRSYAVKLRDGLVQVLNDNGEALYNNFPKVSGSGSEITLENTLEAPMKNGTIDGDTYQQTYTGKNLFNKNSITSGYLIEPSRGTESANESYGCSDYIPVKANTQYTRVYCNNWYGAFYDENKNYVEAIQNQNVITPSVDGYVRISFLLTNKDIVQLEQGSTSTSYEPYVGGQASPNPDYPQDIQSVEGIQNVSVSGGNIIDLENSEQGGIDASGNLVSSNTLWRASTYTPVKSNTKYTLSSNKSNLTIRLYEYDENYNFISPRIENMQNCSVITTNNTKYLKWTLYYNGTTITKSLVETFNLMLKEIQTYEVNLEGKNLLPTNEFTLHRTNKRTIQINFTTPLPAGTYTISWKIANSSGLTNSAGMGWSLYNGTTNVGSLPTLYDEITTTSYTRTTTQQITHLYAFINSNALSDATITIENLQIEKGSTPTTYVPYRTPIKLYNGDKIVGTPDNWSVVRNNGSVVLNGTESMGYNSSSEWLYVGISQFTSNYKVEPMKSNYFTYAANMGDTSVEGFGINNALSPTHFVFRNLQLTSKNDWTTWLSTHNTEVVYKLATPTTEQITDTYLISQLNALYNAKSKNGQTNISVSGNLPMILEVSALKDEI